jgi:hypothetical protein
VLAWIITAGRCTWMAQVFLEFSCFKFFPTFFLINDNVHVIGPMRMISKDQGLLMFSVKSIDKRREGKKKVGKFIGDLSSFLQKMAIITHRLWLVFASCVTISNPSSLFRTETGFNAAI